MHSRNPADTDPTIFGGADPSLDLEKQQGKLQKFMDKVEAKKEKAAELFKLGQYGDAIKQYKAAAEILDGAGEDFPLFVQDLSMMEAKIFNNIAACAKKELNSK